jgi:hypothetical protein
LTALLFSRERRRGEREEDVTESLKSTPGGEWLDGLEIGALGPADAEDALGVLARGTRDTPVHGDVYGDDAERRHERLRRGRVSAGPSGSSRPAVSPRR